MRRTGQTAGSLDAHQDARARRRKRSTAALLVAMLPAAGAAPLIGGEIRIWPTAIARADVVTLGDVAEVRGFGAAAAERIAGLVVHAAPRAGGEILVRAEDVNAALAEAGVNLAAVRVYGCSRCRVHRPRPERTPGPRKPANGGREQADRHTSRSAHPEAREDSRDPTGPAGSLESRLREFIEAQFSGERGRLEVRFGPTSRGVLALREPEHRFKIRSQDRRRLGLVSFQVDVIQDMGRGTGEQVKEPVRTVPVVAEVALVCDVVVARRPINQGQVVTGRDLKLEERRFERLDAVGLTEFDAALGLASRRFLKEGEMLDARSLEVKPLIERGDLVKILLRGQGLEIRTTGTAQEAGALGDLITVRRDGAKRKQDLIEAVVSGPGLVTYRSESQLARR